MKGEEKEANLTLHVCYAISREAELVQRNLGIFQIAQKSQLALEQEQQTLPHFTGTRCPTDAVNVIARIVWRIELDYPIHLGDVKPSSGYVCAEQGPSLGIAELEECVGAFLLFLLTLLRH